MKPHTIPLCVAIAISSVACDRGKLPTEGGSESAVATAPSISEHEALANEIMDTMTEFAAAVATVSDLESANKAAAKMGDLGDRFAGIAERLKPLSPPSKELKEAIDRKMKARDAGIRKVMEDDLQKTMRSLSPEARQVLQRALEEYFGKIDKAGREFGRHFGE